MNLCAKCSKEVAVDSTFCNHCGSPLAAATQDEPKIITPAEQAITLQFDKKLIAKILLIASCSMLAVLFFIGWFSNGTQGVFSPFNRAMRIAQLDFNGRYAEFRAGGDRDEWHDRWATSRTDRRFVIDPGFVVFDILLTAFAAVTLFLLVKIIYNISRKKETGILWLYKLTLKISIAACAFTFVGSVALNNITRQMGYDVANRAITFESNISFTFAFYLTVLVAVASMIFVTHFYKEAQK